MKPAFVAAPTPTHLGLAGLDSGRLINLNVPLIKDDIRRVVP